MKKIILLFLVSVLFASCGKDNTPASTGKWDSNAMINLRPAAGTKALGDSMHLSALEIVKQTANLKFINVAVYGNQVVGRGFSEVQRDTVSPMLKMWGTDIIDQEGNYVPDFIEASDCVLQRIFNGDKPNMVIDTIAYIPNSVLRLAESQIKTAYAVKDYTTCYKIFNDAFIFIPITGKEWRALKAQNLQ